MSLKDLELARQRYRHCHGVLDAGVHELKGIPEQWHLYRVLDVAP